jgi:hypothetical protein
MRVAISKFLMLVFIFAGFYTTEANAKNYLTPWGRRVVAATGVGCALLLADLTYVGAKIKHSDIYFNFKYELAAEDGVTLYGARHPKFVPQSVTFAPLNDVARNRFVRLYREAADEYPKHFLPTVVERVFIGENVSNQGHAVGGAAFADKIYDKGIVIGEAAAADDVMKVIFHHEIFHRIVLANWDKFPHQKWQNLLPKKFEYLGDGLKMIQTGIPHLTTEQIDQLNRAGFWDAYSTSGYEEDIATLGGLLMNSSDDLRKKAQANPVLASKVDLIYEFLVKVDQRFFRANF